MCLYVGLGAIISCGKTLYSGIIFGGVWWTIWVLRIKAALTVCKTSNLPILLRLQPTYIFIIND